MTIAYEDFKLIVTGADGHYSVQAAGPGGINIDPIPFTLERSDQLIGDLEHIKWGLDPDEMTLSEIMIQVGTRLYQALFPLKIVGAFNKALGQAEDLRLKLKIVPPELNDLPWELLYDPLNERYLAARRSMPIVRFIESSSGVNSWSAKRAPRVLYIQANPGQTHTLETSLSERELKAFIGDMTAVKEATPDDLLNHLLDGYDILHYDGHATFDDTKDTGFLYLHDTEGNAHKVSARALASYLDDAGLRLVVLAACETAVEDSEKLFSGIAQQLMHTVDALPAVVAMQFAIPDKSAIAFTRGFYRALAAGKPVDAATVEGRRSILATLKEAEFDAPDWFTPVLYMHTENGDVFFKEESEMSEKKEDEGKRVDTGGGDFIGRDKIVGGDEVHGDKVMGDKVGGDKITVGDVSGTGIAIGRGASAEVHQGISGAELNQLFQPLMQTVEEAPSENRQEATQKANELKEEVAKGSKADDSKVAGLIDDVVKLAPAAAGIITGIFTNPAIGAAVGAATKFVLGRIGG